MLRSTQSLLKRAVKLSRLPVPSPSPVLIASRASSTAAPPSSDYDRIMRAPASNFSSVAGADSPSPAPAPMSALYPSSSPGAVQQQQSAAGSNRYRSVHEPTGREDYDAHELHHPPSQGTQVSYHYDPSFDH